MKFNLNVVHVIHRSDKPGHQLARLNCSGIMSSPAIPRVGEMVCLSMGDPDSTDDQQKVEYVYYDLTNGVMTPDIYLEDHAYDVQHRTEDGVSEKQAVIEERKWVEEYMIPALKKQGFTKFEWRKALFDPTS